METRHEKRQRLGQCGGCGADEGDLHDCDHERCPWCGGQLSSCGCQMRKMGYGYDENESYSGMPPKIYFNGLNEEDEARWLKILNDFGRVPYVDLPQRCARCGENWDGFCYNQLDYWEYYFPTAPLICEECYNTVKTLIDKKNPITKSRMEHIRRKREYRDLKHRLFLNQMNYTFKQSKRED